MVFHFVNQPPSISSISILFCATYFALSGCQIAFSIALESFSFKPYSSPHLNCGFLPVRRSMKRIRDVPNSASEVCFPGNRCLQPLCFLSPLPCGLH